ncbi:MAG TPA: carboxypeptidase-like regulatory domain-containing protein [Bryobacteraceae bacterium]
MKIRSCVAGLLLLAAAGARAQVTSTSTLSGTVLDTTGAVIPGAAITVQNEATGVEFHVVTAANGTFSVPALPSGMYAVAVEAKGFKRAQVPNIKLDVGIPTDVQVRLEIGSQTETITVQGESAILQTQTSAVATTLQGRQIVELPLVSREALDLALYLPGITTPGRPRTSTVDGIGKASINITMDGINVQDNNGKSTDGFYTYVRPRLDAVQEVTVSTGASGADNTGEGAVQVKFITRSGTNDFHGSLYEYHRNPSLNANYWFNNRDSAPDPATGKAPRTRVLLNQFGGRAGGPIVIPRLFNGHNKAFFFVNYEEFRLPEQGLRTRSIFDPATEAGTFQYNATGGVRQVNLLSLATANGQTATIDPTIGKLLGDIRSTVNQGSVAASSDPNIQRFTFINKGGQIRKFTTVRFDVNLNTKNSLEFSWNYQYLGYTGAPMDFLNNSDPAFPGFPNHASIPSNRFSGVIAWRSTLTARIVNELRAGLQGGTILFFPEVNIGQFTGPVANQQGFNLGINVAGITSATVQNSPNRSNTPVKQINDNLNIARNAHTLQFGFSFTQVNRWAQNYSAVPSISFSVDPTDPASAMFTTANFAGASSTDLTNAKNIYAVLTGRVTQISANAQLDESGKYVYNGISTQRYQQRETGFFGQDSWRARKDLTINVGLRWEVQFPFIALNQRFATTTYAGLFGVSGENNLFKPGTLTGQPTQFNQLPIGQHAFNTQWANFAPSLGVAWNPDVESPVLRFILGAHGRGVIRAGYSLAYTREGNAAFAFLANNPGGFVSATRNSSTGNLVTGTGGDTLPLLLRQPSRLGPPPFDAAPVYPMSGVVTNSVNAIDPNLKMPYVQTWSFGIQREIGHDMVLEVRYLGDHDLRDWTTRNLNEVNFIENGFLDEFRAAQANFQANMAAGRGTTFAYFGPGTNTAPLPTILAYFSGVPASQAGDRTKYTSSLFSNSTYYNTLAIVNPNPGTFVQNLATNSAAQRASALAAGVPSNFFVVNPDKLGGANLLTNFGGSTYNAGTVDLRRRLSRGLLFDVNYTFSKSIADIATSVRFGPSKAVSQLNITHALKANWLYELPFGKGKRLLGDAHGVLGAVISGWGINGGGRIQSGAPFSLGNVRLVGMTRQELQSAVGMRFNDGAKLAYYLPQDIIDNTIRAFNTSATSANGYGAQGAPTGRYIAPANSPGCVEAYTGQCGGTSLILYGPHFTRFDISAVKKTRITERVNLELRGEFLNAFNNIDFVVGSANNNTNTAGTLSSNSFGQVTEAYRDTSTTYDPGGRLVQLVLRINF